MFLSSYRNEGESLGEPEMLWEHEPLEVMHYTKLSTIKTAEIIQIQIYDLILIGESLKQYDALLTYSI